MELQRENPVLLEECLDLRPICLTADISVYELTVCVYWFCWFYFYSGKAV